MQKVSLDVIPIILKFLYLEESSHLGQTCKFFQILHLKQMKIQMNIILPLLDYHCVKATLKEMKSKPNLEKICQCWDERVTYNKRYCACARNRYVPLIKNETKNPSMLLDEKRSVCQCAITTSCLKICNPSTYLCSISRHLSEEYQFLRMLEIIKFKFFRISYKKPSKCYYEEMNKWLSLKKMDQNIFPNIPQFKRKREKIYYGEIKRARYY